MTAREGPTIYLLRHGETRWNREGRVQGNADSPLTERGREQALGLGRALRTALRDREGLALHSSPLGRAKQSARLVARELGYPEERIVYDDALREVGWGEWEGRRSADLRAERTDRWSLRNADQWNFEPPGGESYAGARRRAAAWLAEARGPGEIVVVSHGMIGRLLRGVYSSLESERILALDEPQNAYFVLQAGAVTRIEVDTPERKSESSWSKENACPTRT